MRKTDKKVENSIREALTEVCELALESIVGFKWLTHLVANYNALPESILVLCVFERDEELSKALSEHKDELMCRLIKEKLSAVNINVKNIKQQIRFDSEEACEKYHGGKWHERFI